MVELASAVAIVAPYYNLLFVLIALYFFIKLFRTDVVNKKAYNLPWKIIFIAVLVFIAEELLTVLRGVGAINIPVFVNGFFEFVIISLFLYALLLQKQKH